MRKKKSGKKKKREKIINLAKKVKPLFSTSKRRVENRRRTNPVAEDPFRVRFP